MTVRYDEVIRKQIVTAAFNKLPTSLNTSDLDHDVDRDLTTISTTSSKPAVRLVELDSPIETWHPNRTASIPVPEMS